ncbi:paired box protein Pax-6-like [Saccoglossus kowalevskii]|uniref:Paired box protein Pax-6-like n=1 Tax=Saccoglossus kowalevskii TaxID=10224 RepID=A0ABM0M179_SACKO|nr:PREDICTED: paired box protein Pax-6-like [Saccoglossus kowalevskii]
MATPHAVREKIVDMFLSGRSYGDISRIVGVSKFTAYSICQKFTSTANFDRETGGPTECSKLSHNVLQHIEYYKKSQPSIYLKEIQNKLVVDRVCAGENVPSITTIHRGIMQHLGMTRKKNTSVAAESTTARNHEWMLDFMEAITNYNVRQLYWLDESHFVEPALRDLLRRQGVELIFQPPYSSQFNVCELCFRYVKICLRGNVEYSYRFTELAVAEAIRKIGPGACRQFAAECGYI